jgi:hypothetical protein
METNDMSTLDGLSDSARPVLFLDVDGVLNCLNATVPVEHIHPGTGFQAFVPEGTRERLALLTEHYEPVWSTAWMSSAHGPFREHLGLPDRAWPYVQWAEYKLPAMLRYAGPRPWAWVDDDAEWEIKALGWTEAMVPGLVVVPDPRVGLTDEHVRELLIYANADPGVIA